MAFKHAFEPREYNEEVGAQTFLVQVASLWFINGAGWIWDRVSKDQEPYSHAEWSQWKQSLEMSRNMCKDDETRSLIGKALVGMQEAEVGVSVEG